MSDNEPKNEAGFIKSTVIEVRKKFSERIADAIVYSVAVAAGLLLAGSIGYTSLHQRFVEATGVTPIWETIKDSNDTFDLNCDYRFFVEDLTDKCVAPGFDIRQNLYLYPQIVAPSGLI